MPTSEDPLWEEYKLIQGKLDKLGEFRFLIKGWAVTLFSGILVACFSASLNRFVVLAAVPVVMVFHYLESHQAIWHAALSRRASLLELKLRQRASSGALRGHPGLAQALAAEAGRRRSTWHGRAILQAHQGFYAALYVMILAAAGLPVPTQVKPPERQIIINGPAFPNPTAAAGHEPPAGLATLPAQPSPHVADPTPVPSTAIKGQTPAAKERPSP